MKYREYLEEYVINELAEEDLLEIYNELLEEAGFYDDLVYFNGDNFLDESFTNPNNAVAAIYCSSNYKYTDDFVKFDRFGNLESSLFFMDLVNSERFLDLLENSKYNINEYEEHKDEEYWVSH